MLLPGFAGLALGGLAPARLGGSRRVFETRIRFEERGHGLEQVVGHRVVRVSSRAGKDRFLEQKPGLGKVFAVGRLVCLLAAPYRCALSLRPMQADRLNDQQDGEHRHRGRNVLVHGRTLHVSPEGDATIPGMRVSEALLTVNVRRSPGCIRR